VRSAWLVLGREKDLQRRLLKEKQFGDKVGDGMSSKFKWNHWCQTSQSNQAERIEEWFLIHV
jgi:hypothetical protein